MTNDECRLIRRRRISVSAAGRSGFGNSVALYETIKVDGLDRQCSGGVYPHKR
ncbi:hypothetical protein D1AOALGA4SA_12333 [Olavius algarvensis Delta 1 endosymbiont]|nr:hypothetical protein D1AOALGA4SA_12333 [Olavius algarvensis Delta 1 endosymbiont]